MDLVQFGFKVGGAEIVKGGVESGAVVEGRVRLRTCDSPSRVRARKPKHALVQRQRRTSPHSRRLASSNANHALNFASRIKNANLARTKSSAGLRIADCLMLLQEHRLNAWRLAHLPAAPEWSDLMIVTARIEFSFK